jgi:hypothetical protein
MPPRPRLLQPLGRMKLSERVGQALPLMEVVDV